MLEKFPGLADLLLDFKHWILWVGIICSCIVAPLLSQIWSHKGTSLKQVGRTVLLVRARGGTPTVLSGDKRVE